MRRGAAGREPDARRRATGGAADRGVLPFVNASGEPEQEYFSDGISEDIVTALAKLRWFCRRAQLSFAYRGRPCR